VTLNGERVVVWKNVGSICYSRFNLEWMWKLRRTSINVDGRPSWYSKSTPLYRVSVLYKSRMWWA